MIEVYGNLWDFEADITCITTNGFVKNNGACVMGRGCALEARERYQGIDRIIGKRIKAVGNIPQFITPAHIQSLDRILLTFPVKHYWWEKADIDLIEASAKMIVGLVYDNEIVAVPRPGCGNGGLNWHSEVKPVLEHIFDDRFLVVDYG